jgi:hypothetical protein
VPNVIPDFFERATRGVHQRDVRWRHRWSSHRQNVCFAALMSATAAESRLSPVTRCASSARLDTGNDAPEMHFTVLVVEPAAS